jgi:hypothetical protein
MLFVLIVAVNRIKDLMICKDVFTEANEMLDEIKTLADYGSLVQNMTMKQSLLTSSMILSLCDHDEPLLLAL